MQSDSLIIDFHEFDSNRSSTPIPAARLREITEVEVASRFPYIRIEGLPFGGYDAWTEGGWNELIEAYLTLEELYISRKNEKHTLFMDDGELQIEADILGNSTNISITLVPFSNKYLTKSWKIERSTQNYLLSWRCVAHSLAEMGSWTSG